VERGWIRVNEYTAYTENSTSGEQESAIRLDVSTEDFKVLSVSAHNIVISVVRRDRFALTNYLHNYISR
jgi:hypothetical protein